MALVLSVFETILLSYTINLFGPYQHIVYYLIFQLCHQLFWELSHQGTCPDQIPLVPGPYILWIIVGRGSNPVVCLISQGRNLILSHWTWQPAVSQLNMTEIIEETYHLVYTVRASVKVSHDPPCQIAVTYYFNNPQYRNIYIFIFSSLFISLAYNLQNVTIVNVLLHISKHSWTSTKPASYEICN